MTSRLRAKPSGGGKRKEPSTRSDAPSRVAPSEDTVRGCQDRALADLAIAATMDTLNGRLRMERSARSWTARANSLEEDQSAEHRSKLYAEWHEEEDGASPMSSQ